LGQTFNNVAVNFTAVSSPDIRVVVHLKGDPASTQYCSTNPVPGKAIDFTKFSTACWNSTTPGTFLTTAQVADIDKIHIHWVSNMNNPYTVKDFCITGITLN